LKKATIVAIAFFYSNMNQKKKGDDNKLTAIAFVTLFVAKIIKEKNVMVASLLSTPIFVSSRKKKKMGYGNKLAVVAFFIATTTKEKKCDGSKLTIVAHFRFK
jgi:hypothetical protein